MDLSILSKDVEYLKKLKIITPNYKDPYRVCQNDDCVCSEDKELFESYTKICTHCTSKLVRIGSEAIINRNIFGIKKMIKEILLSIGFKYQKDIVKQFNQTKIEFMKFSDKNNNNFLVYPTDKKSSLDKYALMFSERTLPVLFVTLKSEVANDLVFKDYSIGLTNFPELFLKYEFKERIDFDDYLKDLIVKYEKWKIINFGNALKTLRDFLNSNFDFSKIEGKTIQRKGNTFERLTTHLLKALSKSWVELGQIYQNKSVPDGLGYIKFNRKSFVFGFDAKLKKTTKSSKGLSPKERENQVKYIKDFINKSRGYGGLKSWIIVVKSEEDYKKYKNSIDKLKKESKFNNIILLGLEPLLKICEIYKESIKTETINRESFDNLLFKVLRHRGDVTMNKLNKVLLSIEQFRAFNVSAL
ncbi:hypothetical protein J4429_04545 [Candidatus Pacearchaeota archaeon]|nr:hypothetical protein [Candidatus Pacearchaeota archaeon]